MQLLIFSLLVHRQVFGLFVPVWWAQMVFLTIWLFHNQVVLSILAKIALAGCGGLKWTRTIDLTLIRRVL